MKRIASLFFLFGVLSLSLACGEEPVPVNQSPGSTEDAADRPVPSPTDESSSRSSVANKPGDVMPSYSADDLSGGTWKLSDEDGVTMLNLWATWCGPCRYEIPALIDLQREYEDRGFQVVGVSMDREGMEPQIHAFTKNAGINYRIVHDPMAQLADIFQTTIIPTTALIDRDGRIVWIHAGIVQGDDPEMLAALEKALERPAEGP